MLSFRGFTPRSSVSEASFLRPCRDSWRRLTLTFFSFSIFRKGGVPLVFSYTVRGTISLVRFISFK